MAYLLRRLSFAGLVALACTAAAAEAPFSHKLHTALIPECTGCHAAVPASTRVEDNLLPKPEVCAQCHASGITPRQTPTPVAINRFSHAQHLRLGNVAKIIANAIDRSTYLTPPPADLRRHLDTQNPCGACHRNLEQNEVVTRAVLPHMSDCLVCHNQIDPPDSCATCHAKTMRLTPASHVEGFFSSHSSGKLNLDKTTCAGCHGRRFTCLGCH